MDVEVEVKKIGIEDETTFRNIYQFYDYEFSKILGWPTTNAGKFVEIGLHECWEKDSNRHPYLIYVDGRLAGLALVDVLEQSKYDDDPNPVIDMSQFFIMAAYQGKGIGRKAAIDLFKRYTGRWHVNQIKENVNAQHFWRKVIDGFTDGNYEEKVTSDGEPVQFFVV